VAVLAGLTSARPAAAQIDMTGRWRIERHDQNLGIDDEIVAQITQTGGVLTTDVGYAGTIDAMSGVFHLERTYLCRTLDNPGGFLVPETIDGTVDASGNTFTGTFTGAIQLGQSCLQLYGTTLGERVDTAVCGNLVLDPGEECDGGACCAADCTYLPEGTVCGTDPTSCFDYTCYPSHQCLYDGSSQPDGDGDGVADRCDPCTGGGPIAPSRLTLDDLDGPAGTAHLAARGAIGLSPAALAGLDPLTDGVRMRVVDIIRNVVVDVTVAGGAYDPATHTGWKTRSGGHGWSYRGPAGPLDRITLIIRSTSAGTLRFRLRGVPAPPATAPILPLTLTLVLDPPLATTGQCGERFYNPPGGTCGVARGGRRILCSSDAS
jgi:hypothetical protein